MFHFILFPLIIQQFQVQLLCGQARRRARTHRVVFPFRRIGRWDPHRNHSSNNFFPWIIMVLFLNNFGGALLIACLHAATPSRFFPHVCFPNSIQSLISFLKRQGFLFFDCVACPSLPLPLYILFYGIWIHCLKFFNVMQSLVHSSCLRIVFWTKHHTVTVISLHWPRI